METSGWRPGEMSVMDACQTSGGLDIDDVVSSRQVSVIGYCMSNTSTTNLLDGAMRSNLSTLTLKLYTSNILHDIKEIFNSRNKILDPCSTSSLLAVSVSGRCFVLIKERKSWHDALKYCQSNFYNGTLAEPSSDGDTEATVMFLESLNETESVWLGANDIAEEEHFVWASDNRTMNSTLWTYQQPDNANSSEDCVEIWKDIKLKTRGLNDNRCSRSKNFLCQTGNCVVRQSDPCGHIFPGSFYGYGQCFKYFDQRMTWEQAKETCLQVNSHLAEPETFEMQQLLQIYLNKSSAWLGAFCSNCTDQRTTTSSVNTTASTNGIPGSMNSTLISNAVSSKLQQFRWLVSNNTVNCNYTLKVNSTTVDTRRLLWTSTTGGLVWEARSGQENNSFVCQTAAVAPNIRLYVALFPNLSMNRSMKGILQVTSGYDKVMYLRFKVDFNKSPSNTTFLPVAPRRAVNFEVGGNVFLNSTDVYHLHVEITASQPVTVVQYITDQSLTLASSTLLYPVPVDDSNTTMVTSHLLSPTWDLNNGTDTMLTVTSLSNRTADVTLVFNFQDTLRVVSLGPISLNKVDSITTSLDSLYQSLNINMKTNLDGTYLYSTQPVQVLIATTTNSNLLDQFPNHEDFYFYYRTNGKWSLQCQFVFNQQNNSSQKSYDTSLDELLPLTHISHEYFIFSTTQERKTVVRCQAVYGWTQITRIVRNRTNNRVLLPSVGDTYDIHLENGTFNYISGNCSFTVHQIHSAVSDNSTDVCVTTLLPSSLWRDEYQFVQVSDNFTATVYIIVDVSMTHDIDTGDINVTWRCQNITGTSYSGCYTVLPSTVTYLHLQLTNRQRPFGAYVVGSGQGSTFCHPMGMADLKENESVNITFHHDDYLQYLMSQRVSKCGNGSGSTQARGTGGATSVGIPMTTSGSSVSPKNVTITHSTTARSTAYVMTTRGADTTTPTTDDVTNTSSETTSQITSTLSSRQQSDAIVAFLKVEHQSLSSFKRTLTSAPDPRVSSQTCGYMGVVIVSLVFILLMLSDVINVIQFVMSHCHRR
ncbi:hypothetical protein Btru_063092 [Bulinus truncatus]|nr:hypothetical protein Btru_063092 [Bulinus truncatus]